MGCCLYLYSYPRPRKGQARPARGFSACRSLASIPGLGITRSGHVAGSLPLNLLPRRRPCALQLEGRRIGVTLRQSQRSSGFFFTGWGFSMGTHYHFHSWRVFVIVCVLPCAVSMVALRFMPESPRFLLEVSQRPGPQ